MMQKNYYALVAGLPDIALDDKKVLISSSDMRELLRDEVNQKDFALVELMFLPYDHINLLNILFKKEKDWDERGNISKDVMEKLQDRKSIEAADPDFVPAYMIEFLERFHGEELVENYHQAEQMLTEGYFNFLLDSSNEFVREVSMYQKNIGNLMMTLNARKYNMKFDEHLVGDDEVTSALKKSRTRDFGLYNQITDIELLIQIFESENMVDRELKLDNHKWQFLDEITFFNYFTIEKVLAFLLKLFIVERWMSLDSEKGKEMFNQLLKDLESDFQIPEEFTLAYGKKK
ncbi:DUF2764 family protein [Natronoflexus pectinivorans]|uniref:Uncharacterized protein DUF2764 n=1 Tax=Natronoflexus pectinivorans TaxID=682526 RepID=A0A4V2RWS1_9BACT|nr:DUF2764 family protein [Natronoflexus pectinivorans]TCO09741.1 uncharacterized protein DUF2764 [Natronoflexus pectinivorans]